MPLAAPAPPAASYAALAKSLSWNNSAQKLCGRLRARRPAGRTPDLSADSCEYCLAMRRSAEICKPIARASRGKHARGHARREHASAWYRAAFPASGLRRGQQLGAMTGVSIDLIQPKTMLTHTLANLQRQSNITVTSWKHHSHIIQLGCDETELQCPLRAPNDV